MEILRCLCIILFLYISVSPLTASKRHALLIGISTYNDTWNSINGVNDINLLHPILKKQGFKNIILRDSNATAANIRKSFSQLEKLVSPGDIVYIHFSGHGQPVEDIDGDEADGWDEAIIPYDAKATFGQEGYKGENHIIDDELNVMISAIRKKAGISGFVYVVLDACHIGDAARADSDDYTNIRGTNIAFTYNNKKYAPRLDTRPLIKAPKYDGFSNTCYLEACRSYQTNKEIKKNGRFYGPLSYYIYTILKNTTLTSDTKWVETVEKMMKKEPQIRQQNIVIQK